MCDNFPKLGAPYRHVDGGLYRVVAMGRSTVDLTDHVTYVHLYPFHPQTWIRPLSEWTSSRFVEITENDVITEIEGTDAKVRQQEITIAKAARRAAQL